MSDQPAQNTSKNARRLELEQGFDASVTKARNLMGYVPTREEQIILDECYFESLNRAMPISLLCGFAAYSACKNGLLRGNTKFRPWLRVFGFSTVGFLFGIATYSTTCQEKFLKRLPNSYLAQNLLMASIDKTGELHDLIDKSDQLQSDGSSYNSEEPSLDSNRSSYPNMQNSLARGNTSNDQQPPSTDANEPRQMNRHVQRSRPSLRPPPQNSSTENKSSENDLVDSFDAPVAKSTPKVTNKYGDAWEN